MVIGLMRLRRLLMWCLFCLAATSVASTLQVQADQHRLELGKPIWLTLRSDQAAVSLNTLDFSAWRHVVAFPQAYYVNTNRDNTAQTLRLRVYPYHQGRLILPALHFLHHHTTPLQFTIQPARDPVTKSPMGFACRITPQQPWQQQQVIVRCQLHLHDPFALLTQATEQHVGFRIVPMQITKRSLASSRLTQTLFRLGWVIFPMRAGKQIVRLRPIEYVRDGVVTRRFYLKPIQLRVKALPAWLPSTIPVGRPGLIQYHLTKSWLATGVLSQLVLSVRLRGVAPSLLPDYSAPLHSNQRFRFYRAQAQVMTRVLASGVYNQLDYRIPLVAQDIGFYRLPSLRLQYFDPLRGTLETHLVNGVMVLVVNGWIKAVMVVLCIGLLFWLGRKLLAYSISYWLRFRQYQRALSTFVPASYEAIRSGMRLMAQAEGGRANLSILQWRAYMRQKSALVDGLPLAQLNASAYGQGTVDLENCVEGLRRICRRRRLAWG